jgi:hypothetical protein
LFVQACERTCRVPGKDSYWHDAIRMLIDQAAASRYLGKTAEEWAAECRILTKTLMSRDWEQRQRQRQRQDALKKAADRAWIGKYPGVRVYSSQLGAKFVFGRVPENEHWSGEEDAHSKPYDPQWNRVQTESSYEGDRNYRLMPPAERDAWLDAHPLPAAVPAPYVEEFPGVRVYAANSVAHHWVYGRSKIPHPRSSDCCEGEFWADGKLVEGAKRESDIIATRKLSPRERDQWLRAHPAPYIEKYPYIHIYVADVGSTLVFGRSSASECWSRAEAAHQSTYAALATLFVESEVAGNHHFHRMLPAERDAWIDAHPLPAPYVEKYPGIRVYETDTHAFTVFGRTAGGEVWTPSEAPHKVPYTPFGAYVTERVYQTDTRLLPPAERDAWLDDHPSPYAGSVVAPAPVVEAASKAVTALQTFVAANSAEKAG